MMKNESLLKNAKGNDKINQIRVKGKEKSI